MNYFESIELITANVKNYFDTVYYHAEIVSNDANKRFPAIAQGDDWKDLSPTDQQEVLYIRRNGDDEAIDELKIGSCGKSYQMKTPLRVVFFKDHAENQNQIFFNLSQSVLVVGTKLKAIKRDKWKLIKEESSGDYTFGATTAYFAIDFYVLWRLIPDKCDQDFCN